MRQFVAKFMFSNKNLSKVVQNYLVDEFIRRRKIAVDIVNPMYEQWNEEFDRLYPNKDGYSDEYNNFIDHKHEDALAAANKLDVNLNLVELRSDCKNFGGFYGYCDNVNSTIELFLEEAQS